MNAIEIAKWKVHNDVKIEAINLYDLIKVYYNKNSTKMHTDSQIKMEYERLKDKYIVLVKELSNILAMHYKWQECIKLYVELTRIKYDIRDINNWDTDTLNNLYERFHYTIDLIKIELYNNCRL